MGTKKSGTIEYTAVAFEQDSGQAMKNDVVRALIELITNCDDAYARARRTGSIDIIVRRPAERDGQVEICVRDRATGLDPMGMEENFVVLGGDRSGFKEGQEVRGLFSRGSKDTAWFGRTVFESIKNGEYTKLVLHGNGQWESESTGSTTELRKQLGLGDDENGLSATMVIARKNTRVPALSDLVHRLGRHVQLRQLVQIQQVTLTEYQSGKLIQAPRVLWESPKSSVEFDDDIVIEGYGCTAHLTIYRLAERSDGPVRPESIHGIEVRGARAGYMNSAFGHYTPALSFIHGVVTCPMIDQLIRDFGSAPQDANNPFRLVSRTRDGLETGHPFMKALTVAVVEKLKPILDSLEASPKDGGSTKLRQDLDKLARLLAEEMKVDLDEEDGGISGSLPTVHRPIVVIPPIARVRNGSKGTLTVLVLEDSAASRGLSVSSSSGACKIVGLPEQLVKHARFEGVLVGQVRLHAASLGSATVVVAAKTNPTIAGSSEVIVHDSEGTEEEPFTLEWKNPAMSVMTGKTRSVRLRAPLHMAPEGTLEAVIELPESNIRLEDRKVTLELTTKGWLEARVRITGVSHSSELVAITALAAGETALGSIRTTQPGLRGGLNILPELRDESAGPTRGQIVVEEDCLKLVMYARHRGLQDRLGAMRPDGSYARESELDTLVVIAEIMASVAGDHIVMQKVHRDPSAFADIDMVIYERTKLVDRYLKILLEGVQIGKND